MSSDNPSPESGQQGSSGRGRALGLLVLMQLIPCLLSLFFFKQLPDPPQSFYRVVLFLALAQAGFAITWLVMGPLPLTRRAPFAILLLGLAAWSANTIRYAPLLYLGLLGLTCLWSILCWWRLGRLTAKNWITSSANQFQTRDLFVLLVGFAFLAVGLKPLILGAQRSSPFTPIRPDFIEMIVAYFPIAMTPIGLVVGIMQEGKTNRLVITMGVLLALAILTIATPIIMSQLFWVHLYELGYATSIATHTLWLLACHSLARWLGVRFEAE